VKWSPSGMVAPMARVTVRTEAERGAATRRARALCRNVDERAARAIAGVS
jgi:hypothetical protein